MGRRLAGFFGGPATQGLRVGLDPDMVDGIERPRIESGLPEAPSPPQPDDDGAGLLKGESGLSDPQPLAAQDRDTASCGPFTPPLPGIALKRKART